MGRLRQSAGRECQDSGCMSLLESMFGAPWLRQGRSIQTEKISVSPQGSNPDGTEGKGTGIERRRLVPGHIRNLRLSVTLWAAT